MLSLFAAAVAATSLFAGTATTKLYCVIDLSGGASASSYPVSYVSSVPSGGFNTDEYKTTKLVMRRIAPGAIPTRDAAVTKPFYCGVFEVTQRQYELVMGTKPSYFSNASYYATRPVEQVSYDMIRGSSNGAKWPTSLAVDSTSFIGKLRTKTGIDEFDLPTEAQWEYACRAGTTTHYNNGKNYTDSSQDSAMDEVGRYWYNGGQSYSQTCDTSGGTAKVGSYLPNAWGLYDMHGNVWEWCLDWYGGSITGDDPAGSSSGSYRVMRGGSWCLSADRCTSSYRGGNYPSFGSDYGFRLVRTLSEDVAGTYTIKFHRYDASDGKTEAYEFNYGVSTALPKLGALGWARRGFDFKGWATSQANAAAGKVWKLDGAWVKDATAEGKTLSIYAIWE